MGRLSESSSEVPALSSTTSTLDSTVDEIVSDHAVSVIESWLHHFPAVHIPTDDDFRALATLTRLKVETVRMWFGQRLRKQPLQASAADFSDINQKASSSAENPGSRSSSDLDSAQPNGSAQIPTAVAQQAVESEAARWVRERGTKCTLTQMQEHLRRYEPRPYQCTLGCGKNFDKRADWRKHEEINYPQEAWICQESTCEGKSLSDPGKISYRKDKFKQHYSNTHRGINCESRFGGSHVLVASKFPAKCGFCTAHKFINWQDRITHIGDHFLNDGYDMTQWRAVTDDEEDNSSADEDDEDFDDEQNNSNNDSGNDFDWHDHDWLNGLSDAKDDSDDHAPGSAPKQATQTRKQESLAVFSLAGPFFANHHDVHVHGMSGRRLTGVQHGTALFEKRSLPQKSERKDLGGGPDSLLSKFPQTRFTRIRVLGIGPYSIVDEVQDWITGNTLARKTVHYTTQRTFRALKTEVEIMKKLDHPHIVRFVGEYTTDHSLSILMTPSADFDLDYLMGTDAKTVDTHIVSQWFSCLASSVDYLHSHSIKHQDIKPSNILIRGNTIFLADFGVAKTFNEFDSTTSTSGNMTRKYCSPETAHDGHRGRKSDIFSLGCVFLEMLSFLLHDREMNFRDYQWKHFIGDGVFYENLDSVKNWLDLLSLKATKQPLELDFTKIIKACKKMMEVDPHDRPSAKDLGRGLLPGLCCEPSPILSKPPTDQKHRSSARATLDDGKAASCETWTPTLGSDLIKALEQIHIGLKLRSKAIFSTSRKSHHIPRKRSSKDEKPTPLPLKHDQDNHLLGTTYSDISAFLANVDSKKFVITNCTTFGYVIRTNDRFGTFVGINSIAFSGVIGMSLVAILCWNNPLVVAGLNALVPAFLTIGIFLSASNALFDILFWLRSRQTLETSISSC
jgi:serine/threonine protein kinase